MTHRRLSKRTTSVNKRKLLQEKLRVRSDKAILKKEKARAKVLQELHNKELELFTEEAFRLSDIVDTLGCNQNEDADSLSQESV